MSEPDILATPAPPRRAEEPRSPWPNQLKGDDDNPKRPVYPTVIFCHLQSGQPRSVPDTLSHRPLIFVVPFALPSFIVMGLRSPSWPPCSITGAI